MDRPDDTNKCFVQSLATKAIKQKVNTLNASYVKSEVRMTVGVNIAIIWYRTPCSLVDRY